MNLPRLLGSLPARLAAAGILLIVLAGVIYLGQERTPAAILQHQQQGLVPAALGSYAAGHPAPTRPDQPKVGLWLEVPSLQIALPVMEGTGGDPVPYWQALHYPGTAAPGDPGNSYLYGHGVLGMFGSLLLARTGDQVLLRDYSAGTETKLKITRVVGRVGAHDLSWLKTTSSTPRLTLQTCVDDNPGGDRYIVIAS